MARFLALDWDHNQLHLVAAEIRGGTVRLQRAAVWREAQSPNPAEVEALGQLLRERLKEAGIAAAPVLACIGRDRVILKDIRHPAVPAYEEPAVVRFQVIKELTDPPDEVVIDYTPAGEAPGGERRALTLIARRELVHAYRELCQAAGLKLAALTPRPFGIVGCLGRLSGEAAPGGGAVAVLAVAERWAEFVVARGETVVFARSLAVGPTLPGEVRRSLAVYNGQSPQDPLQAVYVAGGEEHASFRENLQNLLGIPVRSFDPLAGVERADVPAGTSGAFAGAVGLLLAQAGRREQPVNFVQPKQPRPPRDPNRQRLLTATLAGVLLLAGLFAFGYWRLTVRDREIAELNGRLSYLAQKERELAPDAKAYGELKKWNDSSVNWLDELYELSAMVRDTKNLQLKQVGGGEHTGTGQQKDYVAKMTLIGATPQGSNRQPAEKLRQEMFEVKYYRPGAVLPASTSNRATFGRTQDFKLDVLVKNRPPAEYQREIEVVVEQPKEKGKGRGGRGAGEGQQ